MTGQKLIDRFRPILERHKEQLEFLGEFGIAGGCIRDYLHNKPIKDIDLFVIVPIKDLDTLYQEIDDSTLDVTLHKTVFYSSSGFLAEGSLYDSEEQLPINIVFYSNVDSIKNLTNSFDLVCNTGSVTLEDVRVPHETNYVQVNNITRLRRNRIDYLQEKYPEWDFKDVYRQLALIEEVEEV